MDDNIRAPTSRQRRNALPRNGNCRLPELLRKIVRVNVATAASRVSSSPSSRVLTEPHSEAAGGPQTGPRGPDQATVLSHDIGIPSGGGMSSTGIPFGTERTRRRLLAESLYPSRVGP